MEALRDVYKVVMPKGNRLVSAWTSLPAWECEYAQGLKTEPPTPQSFLFAFRSFEGAEAFAYDSLTQIWLARGETLKPAPKRIPIVGLGSLNGYWLHGKITELPQPTPDDTILCRAITLLERVR